MENTDDDYLWEKRDKLIFKLELSALYHLKRERFFDILDKMFKAISLIGGSAAIFKISEIETVKYIAASITITSSLSLVLSFSDRSKKHAEFAKNYRKLNSTVLRVGERDFDENHIKEWEADACDIESSEPLALSTLTVICQNELAISRGDTKSVCKVPWYKIPFIHIFDMPQNYRN
jgi:hypothetical protein